MKVKITKKQKEILKLICKFGAINKQILLQKLK